MTNYNERLEEILYDYWARHRNCDKGCQSPDNGEITKAALTSLYKELVAEAKPGYDAVKNSKRDKAINEFEQNLLKALEEMI